MTETAMEDVTAFRHRAGAWISANLQPVGAVNLEGLLRNELTEEEELAAVTHDRAVQRMLFDAGFAGICIDPAYGGQGLTPAHQEAFNEELAGYEFPIRMQAPTFAPCAAVLLEFGTEEQKRRHIPAILKGEEIWMQLLSEPSGGSDVAAALTTAVRDGDEWVLNGSKIWTSGAWWSDWGLCLARTNWDVPKHRGMSVFMLPLRQAGIEIHRIEMLNGSREFCQEFMTDVRVPDADRIGDVDDGWTVGIRWMFHERMLYNSPLVTFPVGATHTTAARSLVTLARDAGRLDDLRARTHRGGPNARCRGGGAPGADRCRGAFRQDGRSSGRHRPFVQGCRRHEGPDHRVRDSGRGGRGVDRRGRRRRGVRPRLPDASDGLHRGRHHRDGAERDQ